MDNLHDRIYPWQDPYPWPAEMWSYNSIQWCRTCIRLWHRRRQRQCAHWLPWWEATEEQRMARVAPQYDGKLEEDAFAHWKWVVVESDDERDGRC